MAERGERVAENLVLRSVETEEDVRRFSAFLGTINRMEGKAAECLLRAHPLTRREEFLVVEDPATGQIVSSSCMIPWPMRYEGIDLSGVQLECVLTHPGYRRRGLVRAQLRKLHELVERRQADVVFLWGIPWYYRQFGYGYCLEWSALESLPARRVEPGPGLAEAGIALRPARESDVPALHALYPLAVAGLDTFLSRSQDHWRYLLRDARFPVHLLEQAAGGKVVGYSIHVRFRATVHVLESAIACRDHARGLLGELARGAGEILVNWPRTQPLVQVAEGLGSTTVKSTQWMMRIPDICGFLRKIRPVLNRRLAASPFAGASRDLLLNLFRDACRISIRGGAIAAVEPAGFVDASFGAEGGNLNIPPDAFLRLAFGQSALEELYDAWPDTVCRPEDRALVAALFPKRKAHLYTPYHYFGPEVWEMEDKDIRLYV